MKCCKEASWISCIHSMTSFQPKFMRTSTNFSSWFWKYKYSLNRATTSCNWKIHTIWPSSLTPFCQRRANLCISTTSLQHNSHCRHSPPNPLLPSNRKYNYPELSKKKKKKKSYSKKEHEQQIELINSTYKISSMLAIQKSLSFLCVFVFLRSGTVL